MTDITPTTEQMYRNSEDHGMMPDNTHEALAKVIADALEWDWPAVPEEHIPSALECVADAASAVLAWLVAEGWSKTEHAPSQETDR
jgi:hypothetical protein